MSPAGHTAVRRATPADIPALVELVYDLAEYEKARHACTLTAEQLHTALFGPAPAVYAHVATLDDEVVGCAIWFLNFSTWNAPSIGFYESLGAAVQDEWVGYRLAGEALTRLAETGTTNNRTEPDANPPLSGELALGNS